MIEIENTESELMGWVCPKCGRVYSPFVPICLHCNTNIKKSTPTKTEITSEENKDKIQLTNDILSEWLNGKPGDE